MKLRKFVTLATAAVAVSAATAAQAFVTINPDGIGFVGKGDVQFALGLNNKALQEQADGLVFETTSTTVSEVSWICTNARNENTQERERVTTTSIQRVLSAVARERNQITGFNLTGYSGTPTTTSTTEGPTVNSCPNNNSTYALTTPAGEPDVLFSESVLSVNGVDLPQPQ